MDGVKRALSYYIVICCGFF